MRLTPPQFPAAVWELSLNNPIGLYIHVPFCESKCPYCDFYSYKSDENTYSEYTAALCQHLTAAGVRLSAIADTLYFGGGTPSLLGGEKIAQIVSTAKKYFSLQNAEITVEVNPAKNLAKDFEVMYKAGVNRISIGVQSAVEDELKALARPHSNDNVIRTVNDAKNAGIDNISVDVMLGIPNQTIESLRKTLDFVLSLGVKHISCYILKIEPETPFGKAKPDTLNLPDEDTVADMYMFVSEFFRSKGFEHYEISNFALKGYRSNHNLKYWRQDEYLGLGPAAHSFLNGKRFYFERDIKSYLYNPNIVYDGNGGDVEEYIMLKMRLSDGINYNEFECKFKKPLSDNVIKNAQKLEKLGLVRFKNDGFALTTYGFLLSNTCITELFL